jgi:hypothetical protein
MIPPPRDHVRRRSQRRPSEFKPALQDLHSGGLINHRTLLGATNTPRGEHPGGRHGGETLVGQSHRNILAEPLGQGASVAGCCLRRWTMPPGQCAREPHHHLDHVVFSHQRHQRVKVGALRPVAVQGYQRRREYSRRI